eukprot:gene16053-21798_t
MQQSAYCQTVQGNLTKFCNPNHAKKGIYCFTEPSITYPVTISSIGYTPKVLSSSVTCTNVTNLDVCPGGYYCPQANTKYPCPIGYYCPPGFANPLLCEWSSMSCPVTKMLSPNEGPYFFLFLMVFVISIVIYGAISKFIIKSHEMFQDKYVSRVNGKNAVENEQITIDRMLRRCHKLQAQLNSNSMDNINKSNETAMNKERGINILTIQSLSADYLEDGDQIETPNFGASPFSFNPVAIPIYVSFENLTM